MDKRARRVTILAALAAALFLGAVLGFGFSVISAHTQRENAEYMISYTMEEEPELTEKVAKILKESRSAEVSGEGKEWLDRYGYTDGYYRSGLLPAYMGISCAGLAVDIPYLAVLVYKGRAGEDAAYGRTDCVSGGCEPGTRDSAGTQGGLFFYTGG